MLPVFLFEIRYRLRQSSTYIFFGMLLLLAFGFIASDVVQVIGGDAQIKRNAPLVLTRMMIVLTIFGTLLSSALVGTSVLRDFEYRTHELFFTTRVTKWNYLLGRFLGSFLVALFVFSGILFGLWLGSLMPWQDHTKMLPFRLAAYLQPFLLFVVPNLLFLCAIFFVLGALTRNLMAIYTFGIVVLVGYLIAQSLTAGLDNHLLAALLDPFGGTPTGLITRYWTPAEKNSLLLPLSGYLLWNRLLWAFVGVAVFVGGGAAFRFSAPPLTLGRAGRARGAPGLEASVRPAPPTALALPPTHPRFDRAARWTQFLSLVGFQFWGMVKSVAFVLIALMGVINFVTNANFIDKTFDTPIYPVTRVMAETIGTTFSLYFLILLTVYAGELVWKERALKADGIHDSLPVPTALVYGSKLTALVLAQALLVLVLIVAGVLVQAGHGYFHFQIGLYFAYLYGAIFPPFVLFTVLAFFIHALVNHKFLGHALVILAFLMTSIILPQLGLEHNLFLFAGIPTLKYSDMNGFGPYVQPMLWFTLYWTAFSVILGVLTALLWVRGTEADWPQRRGAALSRWGGGARTTLALAALAFVVLGGFIFYNTNVLNDYLTARGARKLQASYEKQYKRYESLPQPRITGITVQADLDPSARQYTLRGTYQMLNKTGQAVPDVHVLIDRKMMIRALSFTGGATGTQADKEHGYYIYHLAKPLPPGGRVAMAFDLAYQKRGFSNDSPNTSIAGNGTFLSVGNAGLPAIGYQPGGELADAGDRRKQGLKPRARMAAFTDLNARRNTYLSNDSDWVNFDATVSTDPDQIALAPGYLQREWMQNGRRYFHYTMDAPILNFYSFLSARYAVRRDHWKNVAIEVYYDPQHPYNVDRMVAAVKASLAYDSANFGPYQFRQMRILEFPAYASFAQSFPNTVPYSEGIGFIARVRGPQDIDYPFYVTAHEVSHQWWAHQVIGGNVQGSEMLSESLAQYSSLMVMEHTYGRDQMRRFLRFSLDRYLRGRGTEREEEQPLMRTENQPYIHYEKGALVFYALRDIMGEAKLNAVLAHFVHDKRFQNPPYTTSQELVTYLRQAAPPDLQPVLTDLFETITLYNNKASAATYTKTGPDKYRVTLTVDAEKLRADAKGSESPVPLRDWIDVGVFAKAASGQDIGKPLFMEKRLVTQPHTTFTLDVVGLPDKAGIDPYNKLIDRLPDDNVTSVTAAAR